MSTLPVPSFVTRPYLYFVCYLVGLAALCLWPFNFHQSNQVKWEQTNGLRFAPPAIAYTQGPITKLVGLQQWTMLMDVKTLAPLRQGRLFGYGLDEKRINLSVDQLYDDLVVRVRTDEVQRPREFTIEKMFDDSKDLRFVLAMAYDSGTLSISIDGIRRLSARMGTIDYSSWDSSYPIVLGSFANGKYGWSGVFYTLVILDRAATSEELANPRLIATEPATVLSYAFDEQKGVAAVDHSVLSSTPLILPTTFSPYKRVILQSPADYWPNPRRPFVRDIFANILIFVPVGYLLTHFVARKHSGSLLFLLPLLTAFCISLLIEIMQSYLPTRNSSTVDIMTNCIGTMIGGYVQRKRWVATGLAKLNVSLRS